MCDNDDPLHIKAQKFILKHNGSQVLTRTPNLEKWLANYMREAAAQQITEKEIELLKIMFPILTELLDEEFNVGVVVE